MSGLWEVWLTHDEREFDVACRVVLVGIEHADRLPRTKLQLTADDWYYDRWRDHQRQDMVRAMMSESLRAVISQTLMKRVGGGRIAPHEIMNGTPAIRNLIREGKIAQMYSAIQTGQGQGMQTLDQCLQELVSKGVVSREEAKYKAQNKDSI